MTISLVSGPANSGKARIVLDAVRARRARGEEPLLVVPTRADVEYYRRELADTGPALGVRVERFEGLIAEIVRRAGRSERVLSPLARERALAVAADRTSLAAIGASRETRGFARALAGFVSELEGERVTPQRLREALRAWARDEDLHVGRLEEIADLYEAYHEVLRELGRVDPERRDARALDALRRTPSLWGGTAVLFYGFDDLTGLQLDTIETLGRVVGAPVTVSLTYEPGRAAFAGRAGTFQTLLPLADEHRPLPSRGEHYERSARRALHHLERFLFEEEPAPAVPAADAVRMLEGAGERAELELVAGEIAGLLEHGVPAGEIAIVHRAPDSLAELLAEVLHARSIPFTHRYRARFSDTAIGRALVGVLAVGCGGLDGQPEGRLSDLLAWLRCPGLLDRVELVDRLEAQARRLGITGGSRARALWEAEHWPLESIDHLRDAAERGPLALIERVERELEWLFLAPRRGRADILEDHELDEAGALAAARRGLAELRELALGAPALAPDPAALIAYLGELEFPTGELPGGEAVAILDPLALRARRVRALFLCGLQEGVFPAPARPEPFLSEEERGRLARASGLRLGRHEPSLSAERYLLYAAVSRPEESLVLSWHAGDDEGNPTSPSLFVDDVCDLFADDPRARRGVLPPGAARTEEFAGIGAIGARATAVAGGPRSGPAPEVGELEPGEQGVLWASEVRAPDLAGAESALAPAGLAPLTDPRVLGVLREEMMWSASSLENWTGCPAQWFVERFLRARDLEPDPEPLARGALAHAALKDTLEALKRSTGSARISARTLPDARRFLHEAIDRHADEHPLSVAAERIPGVRRRLEIDLERYLEHAARGESPLEPAHLELSFGFPDEPGGLPALELGEGVRLRGRIDRIDIDRAGHAVLYDYKGSHAPEAAKWVQERSIQLALYMRAAGGLLDLEPVGGFYQPLSGRDLRARGLLTRESELETELECVKGDVRTSGEFQELLEELVGLAREAAAEARTGALQARPDTCGFGGSGCRYPTICRCER